MQGVLFQLNNDNNVGLQPSACSVDEAGQTLIIVKVWTTLSGRRGARSVQVSDKTVSPDWLDEHLRVTIKRFDDALQAFLALVGLR